MMTPKQQRFVEEYLIDLNAADAARRAGYSERTARVIGPENLTKPAVQAAIAASQAKRSERTEINADWVLRRLAAMADADMADLHAVDGSLRPVSEWPEIWRRGLVAGIEADESVIDGGMTITTRKVKLADRLKAIELIGRHVAVGAWRDRTEHTGPGGGPMQFAAVDLTGATVEQLRALASLKLGDATG